MQWKPLLILSTMLWIGLSTCKLSGPKGDANGGGRQNKKCMRSRSMSESSRCECGVANSKNNQLMPHVINGDLVEPKHKYPWMIAIEYKGRPNCGASILTSRSVLTAAHCLIGKKTILSLFRKGCFKLQDGKRYCSVPLRKLRLRYFEPGGKETYVKISSFVFDTRFTTPDHNYDIALIRTEKALPCNRFTAPICLPTEGDGLYRANTTVTVAGWGRTKVGAKDESSKTLREGNLRIADDEKSCKTEIKTKHFCGLINSQTTCFGDSGGPVFKEHGGHNYVIGITSYGTTADCNLNTPDFYTKVHEFLPWINKHLDLKSELGPNDKEIKK